jgi:hypothetical protein
MRKESAAGAWKNSKASDKAKIVVRLASCGNPDMGQDPDQPYMYCEPDRMVPVESFAEASKACRRFISDNELGAGHWSGGSIFIAGQKVAYVSYNGRVWDMRGNEIEVRVG